MDLSSITDDYLDEMRTEPKHKVSATRPKIKGKHEEQQYECVANDSDSRRYRVFTRQCISLPGVFSVGMCLIGTGGDDLILCRYNSGHHTHRNRLDGTRVGHATHIHLATARYIHAGLDPDGFAVETSRYTTMKGALVALVVDCNIEGILDPEDIEIDDLFG